LLLLGVDNDGLIGMFLIGCHDDAASIMEGLSKKGSHRSIARALNYFVKMIVAARNSTSKWCSEIYDGRRCGRLSWNVYVSCICSDKLQSKRGGHMPKLIDSHFISRVVEMKDVV